MGLGLMNRKWSENNKRFVVEEVHIHVGIDHYFSLKALSKYSNISVRKLREYLYHPLNPLPHYRVGGKILVRQSEFDRWIETHHQSGVGEVDKIVDEVLNDF